MDSSRGLGADAAEPPERESLWCSVLKRSWSNYWRLRGTVWCGGTAAVLPACIASSEVEHHPFIGLFACFWLFFGLTVTVSLAVRRLFPEAGLGCLAAFKGWLLAFLGLFLLGMVGNSPILQFFPGPGVLSGLVSLSFFVVLWCFQFYPVVSNVEGLGLFQGLARSVRLLAGYPIQSIAAYCSVILPGCLGLLMVAVLIGSLEFGMLQRLRSPFWLLYGSALLIAFYQIESLALNLGVNLTLYQELRARQS